MKTIQLMMRIPMIVDVGGSLTLIQLVTAPLMEGMMRQLGTLMVIIYI